MSDSEWIFKVSELNHNIKYLLEEAFDNIWVEGEISGFKESSLGHVYFDLKDEESVISCVIFKWGYTKFKDLNLRNGLLVRVRASLTIYDKQSKYQLIVKDLISFELGPLQLKFEELKRKLMSEGLFDEARKKKIPLFPEFLAVVTSLHGAAVRDILSILKRRFPSLNIIIYPVKVQGDGAAEEISQAIYDINKYLDYVEVILVGRGGGSMQDLWAFNEEIVARAIYNSKIPVISCVGHQTDYTIADFVADLRAPTPSAAAELVVKNREEVIGYVKQLEKRLLQSLRLIYHKLISSFMSFVKSKYFLNPYYLIQRDVILFDNLYTELLNTIDSKIENYERKIELLTEKLKHLDPRKPLEKGYTLVKKSGEMIKSASQVDKGDMLDVLFYDGNVKTRVINKGDGYEKK